MWERNQKNGTIGGEAGRNVVGGGGGGGKGTDRTIEIETKFNVPDDYVERIESLGGKLARVDSVRDVYYDTNLFDLLRNDHWLRNR